MSRRLHQQLCWCAICGLRFSDFTKDVPSNLPDHGGLQRQAWLEEAVLLSDCQDRMLSGPHASESAAESILGETTSQDGIHMIKSAPAVEVQQPWLKYSLISIYRPCNGQMDEDGQIVDAYRTQHIRNAKLNFPFHSACLSLAKRLMEASAKGQYNTLYGGPKSMRQLWDILLSRFWHGCPKDFEMEVEVSTACLPDPHNHYLGDSMSMISWYPKHNSSFANPINVSGITEYILSLLQPVLEQDVSSKQSVSTYMAQLAPELKQAIVNSLLPLRNLPLQCTRLLDQSYWKEMLMSGRFLPFLWDLDLGLIERKVSQLPGKLEWNWERLVRQLSQSGFLDYAAKESQFSHYVRPVPYGLRNRRRIWRILEEMKLDDMKQLPHSDMPTVFHESHPASSWV